MKVNDVWTLVDSPEQVKPIGCKWIFKWKRRVNKNMETYKVRMIVKGYH